MKYRLISLLLILSLSFPASTAATQLYNINNVANAINQNANQQIMITGLPTITTSTITTISPETNNDNNNNAAATNATAAIDTTAIPTAQSVYTSQSMTLPISVKSFVWYIVAEAHENTHTSSYKKVSDHNPDYVPTNVVMPQGVSLTFLDADAPWDTPHPHTINILDSRSGNYVYSTA